MCVFLYNELKVAQVHNNIRLYFPFARYSTKDYVWVIRKSVNFLKFCQGCVCVCLSSYVFCSLFFVFIVVFKLAYLNFWFFCF